MKTAGVETIKTKDCTWRVRDKEFATFLLASSLPFSSFLSHPPHQRIKKGKKKALWEMKTTESGGTVYLVKVYRNTNLLSQLKELFNGSKASREFQAAREVAERHIPTFLPVAAGEKKKNGLIQESYLVMEKVEECLDLGKYLLRDEKKTGWHEKKKVIVCLGRLTREIHDQGILQIDLALNNFLIKTAQAGELELFFSDFEKVKFLPAVSESQRFAGLAKLNRVGREISLADRLHFLKAYLSPAAGDRERFHTAARHLQSLTLETLKRDGQRGRMTSVYTDCYYKTYRDEEFHGYYRDGYRVEELLDEIRDWNQGIKGQSSTQPLFQGTPVGMKVKCYQKFSAAKVWSNAFTLSLGMLPVILPRALFEKTGTDTAFIFFPREGTIFTLSEFLSRFKAQGIAQLSGLLSSCHQFGTFSGKLSEDLFSFSFEDGRATPYLADMDSFSIQKKVSQGDRERDLSSLIALLSSYRDKGDIEELVRSYSMK